MAEPTSPPTAPAEGGDAEEHWLRHTYRPDAPNLTVRAALIGMAIGAVMCMSNLYVFFKTGWSMGVTLTACILAFAAFQGIKALKIPAAPFGPLENNALTTVASGAGYMTGGGNMAAFGALLMVTTVRPGTMPLILWFAVIAALGVFAAIPIKRQLINRDNLAFPTGTATAETIESLHAAGAGGGSQKAIALGVAGLVGALVAVGRDALKLIPATLPLPIKMAGYELGKWTIGFKTEVLLIGAGALMSFRTGWSMLLGGLVTYGLIAPALVEHHEIATVSYKAIVNWTLWPGAGILVGSGITSFLLDWKSLKRAFAGMTKLGKRGEQVTGIAAVEAPDWWFPAGYMVLGPIVVALMSIMFDIPVWAAVVALPLSVVMGFIAARVTGETDTTPTKALGPVTQMVFGAMAPGNLSGNIMSANVTGGVGLHAADLLTTLKTGWLLGAKPRHQVYAQLLGVLVGAAVIVPVFNAIIPDPSVLGSDEWPAPSCLVWSGVSAIVSNGLGGLSHAAKQAMVVGLALGIVMAIVDKLAPARVRRFLPSPAGVGIAMVIPASNSIAMFLGATIAEVMRRRTKAISDQYVVPVASGLIAGESLAGIAVAMLIATGVLAK
ncbi:MAG: OPT/YSL family transporter [Myxococcales bacterium]|nr:OPT/YSL family transporter [Myxococcales bacterium]